jgi:hypothetical protein
MRSSKASRSRRRCTSGQDPGSLVEVPCAQEERGDALELVRGHLLVQKPPARARGARRRVAAWKLAHDFALLERHVREIVGTNSQKKR